MTLKPFLALGLTLDPPTLQNEVFTLQFQKFGQLTHKVEPYETL